MVDLAKLSDDELAKGINQVFDLLVKEQGAIDAVSRTMALEARLYALTTEQSFRLQNQIGTLTKGLIKWNRILALSTSVLALIAIASQYPSIVAFLKSLP